MAIWDKVVEIANKAMNTEASQILGELKAACPYRTGTTQRSFHIMRGSGNATVSVGGSGLITSVRIGSTLDSAYYADQGNSATSKYVSFAPYPGWDTSKRPYVSKDGMVHSHGRAGYEGKHFVKAVADRHR